MSVENRIKEIVNNLRRQHLDISEEEVLEFFRTEEGAKAVCEADQQEGQIEGIDFPMIYIIGRALTALRPEEMERRRKECSNGQADVQILTDFLAKRWCVDKKTGVLDLDKAQELFFVPKKHD